MQIRDKKTLTIDTIFPIILIMAGLALSTIAFFTNGVGREMSPSIYSDNFDMDMIYNSNSALITTELKNQPEIKDFMTTSWKGMNVTLYDLESTVDITLKSDKDTDIFA